MGTGHGSSHGFFPQFEPVRVMNYSVEEWTLTVVKKFIRGGTSATPSGLFPTKTVLSAALSCPSDEHP